jgi:hypothetical protein
MMSVDHEVGVADLDDLDRWEVTGREPPLDRAGALLEVGPQRVEAAVKVATAPGGTDDARHLNRTHATGDLRSQAEASANVVEVEQGTAVAVAEHAHSIAQRQS